MNDPNRLSDQARGIPDIASESTPSAASEVAAPAASEVIPPADSESTRTAATSQASPAIIPITFGGSAEQYFSLYVTNTLLTIITLGIYSAWARVRDRRFFMGHSYIGNHNLEFDARPLEILISRIIAVAFMALVIYFEEIFELFWSGIGIFFILTMLLMPIALVRGRAFIARHTIHRTVRFRYRLEYLRAIVLFLGYTLLLIPMVYTGDALHDLWEKYFPWGEDPFPWVFIELSLSALIALFILPLLLHLSHRIQISQLQFGNLRFFFAGRLMRYYQGWGLWILAAIVLTIVFLGLVRILSGPIMFIEKSIFFSLSVWLVDSGYLGLVAFLLCLACLFALYRGVFTCLYWRSFRFGKDSEIESDLDWWPYARLLVTNYVLIVLTVGLLYPWARVRAYRYVAERLRLRIGAETAVDYSLAGDDITALAGEFSDISGWDFDFGAI